MIHIVFHIVGNYTCTMVRGEYLVKKDCQDLEPCGICKTDSSVRFRLKGSIN